MIDFFERMENSVSTENTSQDFLEKDGIPALPDWKKLKNPFEKIAGLNIDTEDKDTIVLWWKMDKQNIEKLATVKEIASSINIPKNEQSDILQYYQNSLGFYKDTVAKLTDFLSDKKVGFFKKVIDLYASTYDIFDFGYPNKSAHELVRATEEFNNSKEDLDLATAVSKAIIETRSANPEEMMIRKKVAQHVLKEMFDAMGMARIAAVNDIFMPASDLIDSPIVEKSELTSALFAKPWTGDERRKMLAKYNKLKRVMDILGTDTEYKVANNTLWKWANGELPKDASVFKILRYADNLNEGVTDTLTEAWQQEAENDSDDDE